MPRSVWKKIPLGLIYMLNIATNSYVLFWVGSLFGCFNLLKIFLVVYSVWLSHPSQSLEAEGAIVKEIYRDQCFIDSIDIDLDKFSFRLWQEQDFFMLIFKSKLLFLYVDTQIKLLSKIRKIIIFFVFLNLFLQWLLESGCWKQQVTCNFKHHTWLLFGYE